MTMNAALVSGQFNDISITPRNGKSKLVLTLGSRLYFNKGDVSNDDVYPTAVSTNQPYSLNFQQALSYQRTTKYGFIYGIGIETGNRSYSFSVDYTSMELIDNPSQVGYADYQREYPFKTRFWGLKVFAGCNYDLKSLGFQNWAIEATAGLCITTQTKGQGDYIERIPIAYYLTGNNDIVNVLANNQIQWGNVNQGFSGPMVGELFLGLCRQLGYKYVQDITIGLTFTHVVKYPTKNIESAAQNGMSTIVTYYRFNQNEDPSRPRSVDSYTPKEMSLGFRCSIGLKWK